MKDSLDMDATRLGHIFDGIDDDVPDQVGMVQFDEKGVELVLPYLSVPQDDPNSQYRKTAGWFRTDGSLLPKTLVFEDDKGAITFTENRISKRQSGVVHRGSIRSRVIFLGRPRQVQDPYFVQELQSSIEGLSEFTGFRPIQTERVLGESGSRTTIVTLDPSESTVWQTEDFELELKASLSWTSGRSFAITDDLPRIVTRALKPATVTDHLVAHRAIRALLILLHGSRLRWVSHWAYDDQFPPWTLGGPLDRRAATRVYIEGTLREHQEVLETQVGLPSPVFGLTDLKAEGMERWYSLYAREEIKRAVQPAVEVLNGAAKFLEPQLLMLAISLDYFGYAHFGDKDQRSIAQNIEKCILVSGADLSAFGSDIAIARGIAKVNNDIKHPDREASPEPEVLSLVVKLSRFLARAQAFRLLEVPEDKFQFFIDYDRDLQDARSISTELGVHFQDNGNTLLGSEANESDR